MRIKEGQGKKNLPYHASPGECEMLRERRVQVTPSLWNLETSLERVVNEYKRRTNEKERTIICDSHPPPAKKVRH